MQEKQSPKKDGLNHYLAGRQAWAEMYGSEMESRKRWRNMTYCCLGALLLALAMNVFQLQQTKIVPYVIEVDQFGGMRGVGKATPYEQISAAVIKGSLAGFVRNWRTVTADVGLQKIMLNRARYMVAGAAVGTIKDWYDSNNPYDRGTTNLVEIRMRGVPLIISGNSWQVEWSEITRNRSGRKVKEENFEASVQIQLKSPETETEILNNPAGVYVTNISWTRKFK